MSILLHKNRKIGFILIAFSISLNAGALQSIQQGIQQTQIANSEIQAVQGTLTNSLGSLQNVNINSLLGGNGALNFLSNIFGLKLKLTCINPLKKRNYDICSLWKNQGTIYNYGNIGGQGGGFNFSINLGICKLGVGASAGGVTQAVKNTFKDFYSSLMNSICGTPSSSATTINETSYNTGDELNSPNNALITKTKGIHYTPITTEIVDVPQSQTISYSSDVIEQNSSKIIYPSQITQKELYGGDGGGYFAYVAKNRPNSTTAIAYRADDTATLVMKDLSIKATAYDNENLIALPKDKNDEMLMTSSKAQLRYIDPVINWSEFIDSVESNLSQTFLAIEPSGNSATAMKADVETKEYQAYTQFVQSDYVQNVYKKQEDMLRAMYADLSLLMTNQKDYIFDPSETKVETLPLRERTHFKYKSLIQMTKETMLKGMLGRAIKYKRELLDIALKKAYICSSPYRPKIAEQELKDMLQNVDSLAQ